MDLNLLFGITTVIALVFAIYQTLQAISSGKKLKELEEGMVLSSFKLKKAVEYYNNGHYKNSLEAFKKYSNESEDYTELKNAIENIFWIESKKLYSKYIGEYRSIAVLVLVIMTKKIESDTKYPDYINNILDIYKDTKGKPLSIYHIPVLLNQEKYSEAIELLPKAKTNNSNTTFDHDFKYFIKEQCIKRITETEI